MLGPVLIRQENPLRGFDSAAAVNNPSILCENSVIFLFAPHRLSAALI